MLQNQLEVPLGFQNYRPSSNNSLRGLRSTLNVEDLVASKVTFAIPNYPFLKPIHDPTIDPPTSSSLAPTPLPISHAYKEHQMLFQMSKLFLPRMVVFNAFWFVGVNVLILMINGFSVMISNGLKKTYSSIIRVVQLHTLQNRVFFTLGELVGTLTLTLGPDPNLLLVVSMGVGPRGLTWFHYGQTVDCSLGLISSSPCGLFYFVVF